MAAEQAIQAIEEAIAIWAAGPRYCRVPLANNVVMGEQEYAGWLHAIKARHRDSGVVLDPSEYEAEWLILEDCAAVVQALANGIGNLARRSEEEHPVGPQTCEAIRGLQAALCFLAEEAETKHAEIYGRPPARLSDYGATSARMGGTLSVPAAYRSNWQCRKWPGQ